VSLACLRQCQGCISCKLCLLAFLYMTCAKTNTRKLFTLSLQATTDDAVFSPSSPSADDFVVDLTPESTNQSVGIRLFGGADTVKGPSAVYIEELSPEGLAACDGRLRAGEYRPIPTLCSVDFDFHVPPRAGTLSDAAIRPSVRLFFRLFVPCPYLNNGEF